MYHRKFPRGRLTEYYSLSQTYAGGPHCLKFSQILQLKPIFLFYFKLIQHTCNDIKSNSFFFFISKSIIQKAQKGATHSTQDVHDIPNSKRKASTYLENQNKNTQT